jgi:hypothetical protein
MRLPADDEFTLVALASRPARQTLGDDLLRELVELRLAFLERALDLGLDLGQRVTTDARIDEISRLGERRGRFSTCPSSPTKTTMARSGSSRTNSTCLSRGFDLAVSTTPAARLNPESSPDASVKTPSTDLAWPEAATCASIARRSVSLRSPTCISASTKKRSPISVGRRPAEVCGA